MSGKHSPGPWRLSENGSDIVDADGVDVCALYASETDAANAALIEAAPDLLAALENLLREADDDGITREGVDQAFSAIAKAKGTP